MSFLPTVNTEVALGFTYVDGHVTNWVLALNRVIQHVWFLVHATQIVEGMYRQRCGPDIIQMKHGKRLFWQITEWKTLGAGKWGFSRHNKSTPPVCNQGPRGPSFISLKTGVNGWEILQLHEQHLCKPLRCKESTDIHIWGPKVFLLFTFSVPTW